MYLLHHGVPVTFRDSTVLKNVSDLKEVSFCIARVFVTLTAL